MKRFAIFAPLALLVTAACNDVEAPDGCHAHGDEIDCEENHGLVTSVVLTFTPVGGGDALAFEWSDPESDGIDPIVDDIVLPDGADDEQHDAQEYTLAVKVWNELEDPAEDVTADIAEQGDVHQFFFAGSAVEGPATGENSSAILEHAYADTDADGLPLGIENTVTTLDWGTGELRVVLRHMPAEGGEPVKVEGLAETVAADGFGAIGGGNDIDVTFNIAVE